MLWFQLDQLLWTSSLNNLIQSLLFRDPKWMIAIVMAIKFDIEYAFGILAHVLPFLLCNNWITICCHVWSPNYLLFDKCQSVWTSFKWCISCVNLQSVLNLFPFIMIQRILVILKALLLLFFNHFFWGAVVNLILTFILVTKFISVK